MDNLTDFSNLTLLDTGTAQSLNLNTGDFESMTVPQLRAQCKLRGLKGYSKQIKSVLLQRLNVYATSTPPEPPLPDSPPLDTGTAQSPVVPPPTRPLPFTEEELRDREEALYYETHPPTEEELRDERIIQEADDAESFIGGRAQSLLFEIKVMTSVAFLIPQTSLISHL
jgi:hypothetical protein